MKLGAYDFILKPVNFDHVQFTINKCYTKIKAEYENEELREANSQLIELNEMKDKFLYITNHEIRTPLSLLIRIYRCDAHFDSSSESGSC